MVVVHGGVVDRILDRADPGVRGIGADGKIGSLGRASEVLADGVAHQLGDARAATLGAMPQLEERFLREAQVGRVISRHRYIVILPLVRRIK
jgi:hypothetical protein